MNNTIIERKVSLEEQGLRLDRCLRLWIPHLPQSMIEKAARKKLLKVEGTPAKPAQRLEEGQTLSFPAAFEHCEKRQEEKKPLVLTAADRKWLKSLILYEDKDILVFNKPSGIAVQSGTNQNKSLDAMLLQYDPTCAPRLVHRLDKDTSGVLVVAKTLTMARWLTQAFKERKIEKTYWALVCGVPSKKEGVIDLALSKKPDPKGEKMRVDRHEGQHAITHYRVLETVDLKVALLELKPQTGRTHQLRVHCAEGLKTPIVGDGKYGGKAAFLLGRKNLHLHAAKLAIPFPSGMIKMFTAPLSEEISQSLREEGMKSGEM